jgi:hypothetical protein
MSVPPQAVAPNTHTNLLNVYIQIANKMGFQKKMLYTMPWHLESKGVLVTGMEAYRFVKYKDLTFSGPGMSNFKEVVIYFLLSKLAVIYHPLLL